MNENQRLVFVKNLQTYMNTRGVDQSDIVSALGVSPSTVSDWATGKKYPRVDSMQRLADYLGVLISDLTSEKSILHSMFDSSLGSDIPLSNKLHALGAALTPSESELLSIFRRLNDTGQLALIATARGLDGNPDMKKDGASQDTTTA